MDRRRLALVVEDDPAIADILRYRLRGCGFTEDGDVVVAPHATEAMRVIDESEPDIVLLDQRLPRSEREFAPHDEVGHDLLQYAKRRRPNTPVIVMTAHAGTNVASGATTAVRFMQLGADNFITKPFHESPEPLEDKVKAALGARDAGQVKRIAAPRRETVPAAPVASGPVRIFVEQHSLADGMGNPRDGGTVKLFLVRGDEQSVPAQIRRSRFNQLVTLARGPIDVAKDSSEDRALERLGKEQLRPWGIAWTADGALPRRRTYRLETAVSIHPFAGALDPAAEVRRIIREDRRAAFRS